MCVISYAGWDGDWMHACKHKHSTSTMVVDISMNFLGYLKTI